MDWDMDIVYLSKPTSDTIQPKSDTTYIRDEYGPLWKKEGK